MFCGKDFQSVFVGVFHLFLYGVEAAEQFFIFREHLFHRFINGERALEPARLFKVSDLRIRFHGDVARIGV